MLRNPSKRIGYRSCIILMRSYVYWVSFFFVSSFAILAESPKPNILFFMADDMGIGDTSAYLGFSLLKNSAPISKTLKTPNIEKFSKRGMIFTDAHAPASMCSSTRYSLLTGRLAHRSYLKKQGWLPHGPNRPMIHKSLITLPEMLQRNGYYTGAVGKYHVGMDFDDGHGKPADEFDYKDVDFTRPILDGPTHHGFMEFFGVPGNTEDSLDTEPRIFIREDKWTFADRSKMHWGGIMHREGQVLKGPDWNLSEIGPEFLKNGLQFIRKAAAKKSPFFLYYVPAANHYQRNVDGDYAVPQTIDGKAVKGASRFTDGAEGGERGDMILENDIAFGALLRMLQKTDDPRNPGHPLIDNTLIIFTSDNGPNVGDNSGTNEESGGLRGKKAKIWEGGHRVPFILSWKNRFDQGLTNRNLFSLTDLFATLAEIIGDDLGPSEALDSLQSFTYWVDPKLEDPRPRYFFCHLGPPYENDAIAIRQKSKKVIVQGGLAQAWTPKGTQGTATSVACYDLNQDPYENADFSKIDDETQRMVTKLIKIHNQGYSRDLNDSQSKNLIVDDGWHNLRNDVTGLIGFQFKLNIDQIVSHLGMWDDHDRELPVRDARGLPTELISDQPSRTGARPRSLENDHEITLWKINHSLTEELSSVVLTPEKPGLLDHEFRYFELKKPVQLFNNHLYMITMTTRTEDGDHFHDDVAFDGLSPLVNPLVTIVRSVLIKKDNPSQIFPIPSFADLHPDYSLHRLPVGPTLRFQ